MDGMNLEVGDGVGEDIEIRRSTLSIEQKRIFLNLRENARGRYLRIAEVTGSNRSTIIIPASGLLQFRMIIDSFIEGEMSNPLMQIVAPVGAGGDGGARGRRKRGGGVVGGRRKGVEGGEGGEADGDQSRRVYVGNLSWATRNQSLKDHFQPYGDVIRAEVFTERSGRSRGCGIVEFASTDQARAAMEMLNNSELDGRSIFVREDRE